MASEPSHRTKLRINFNKFCSNDTDFHCWYWCRFLFHAVFSMTIVRYSNPSTELIWEVCSGLPLAVGCLADNVVLKGISRAQD